MNWHWLRPRFGSNMTRDQIDQAPGYSTYSADPNFVGFVLIAIGITAVPAGILILIIWLLTG